MIDWTVVLGQTPTTLVATPRTKQTRAHRLHLRACAHSTIVTAATAAARRRPAAAPDPGTTNRLHCILVKCIVYDGT